MGSVRRLRAAGNRVRSARRQSLSSMSETSEFEHPRGMYGPAGEHASNLVHVVSAERAHQGCFQTCMCRLGPSGAGVLCTVMQRPVARTRSNVEGGYVVEGSRRVRASRAMNQQVSGVRCEWDRSTTHLRLPHERFCQGQGVWMRLVEVRMERTGGGRVRAVAHGSSTALRTGGLRRAVGGGIGGGSNSEIGV